MKRILGVLLMVLVASLGLSFAVLNAEPVPLRYYFGTREFPLAVVVVAALALGAVLGATASMGMVLRHKREIARLRKSVKLTEKEVMNLRAIPLKDAH